MRKLRKYKFIAVFAVSIMIFNSSCAEILEILLTPTEQSKDNNNSNDNNGEGKQGKRKGTGG